jgi:hypothetical protein
MMINFSSKKLTQTLSAFVISDLFMMMDDGDLLIWFAVDEKLLGFSY